MTLDLHDWSIVNNRLDLLKELYNYFDDFRVSLFTVPIDEMKDWGAYQSREYFLNEIRGMDWLQLIPHGYTHEGSEMRNADYRYFKEITLPAIKKAFEKDGLKYEKGFCAPHWRWSDGVVRALDEEGWWGAVDPRQNMKKTNRYFKYDYPINDFPAGDHKLHGHIYGTKNDLGLCMNNLLRLPKNTKWEFITNYIETNERL
jgi:hypothetical protein